MFESSRVNLSVPFQNFKGKPLVELCNDILGEQGIWLQSLRGHMTIHRVGFECMWAATDPIQSKCKQKLNRQHGQVIFLAAVLVSAWWVKSKSALRESYRPDSVPLTTRDHTKTYVNWHELCFLDFTSMIFISKIFPTGAGSAGVSEWVLWC